MPNGAFDENCYLVWDPAHPDTVLIDPGEDVARFLGEAAARSRSITAIWLTHAHLDHVQGVAEVRAATGAPIHLHPADLPLYRALEQQARWLGLELRLPAAPEPAHRLAHGQRLRVGGTAVEVRHAPGHSPGHVVFRAGRQLFGGDVLFAGSIGRSDLPGGDPEVLLASIERELLSLPDDTMVYPGHGPATTVGQERLTNPFLIQATP